MINFILTFPEPFPLSRITAYNIMLTFFKNICCIITNHLRYNKIASVELNQKSSNFCDLTCLFNKSCFFLVTCKDSLIKRLNLSKS